MLLLRRAFHLSPFGLAIAGAVGPVFLSLVSLVAEVPKFVDPCVNWGITGGREVLTPARLVACHGRVSGTSQTRLEGAIWLILVQGGMLAASAAALLGARRYRLRPIVLAFAFMLLITVPLAVGNFGLLTLISAVCFGVSAVLVAWHVRRASVRGS
jgi:hypothetical protein